MIFDISDYEELQNCPWCESDSYKTWGRTVRGFKSVKCRTCGLIYVKNRLNETGLQKYYGDYLSKVHQVDAMLNKQRTLMYELEFSLIHKYMKGGSVLDVGCSGGYFLDMFSKNGYECFGVEFGKEAASEAKEKYKVWDGNICNIKINRNFDLIIFRGVIEHISYPKAYLDKAVSLLNSGAMVYITSTPNRDAFCCNLFKEMWNQHEPEAHLMHFGPSHFDQYFSKHNMTKVVEHNFYEDTPYANIDKDILNVAKAIKAKASRKKIDFRSPAFWGNMMSLIYKK